jgi:hypothetical protein
MVECVCIDKIFAGYVSPIPRYLLTYSWVFPDRLITYLLVTSVISPRKEPPSPIAARCNAVSGIGAWVRGCGVCELPRYNHTCLNSRIPFRAHPDARGELRCCTRFLIGQAPAEIDTAQCTVLALCGLCALYTLTKSLGPIEHGSWALTVSVLSDPALAPHPGGSSRLRYGALVFTTQVVLYTVIKSAWRRYKGTRTALPLRTFSHSD